MPPLFRSFWTLDDDDDDDEPCEKILVGGGGGVVREWPGAAGVEWFVLASLLHSHVSLIVPPRRPTVLGRTSRIP